LTESNPVLAAPSNGDRYSITIITVDDAAFAEMRRFLSPVFQITLARNELQIKALM
jgi:hypothetical protein